jgi:uncharacterized membrane protein
METRPKIRPDHTPFDKKLELTCTLFLIVIWCFTVYAYLKLPETIPTHFTASGIANDYGSKTSFLILPIIATLIYLGLTQINKYPYIFNYTIKITEENAQKQYTIATRMLRYLKLVVLIIFSLIILFIYLTTIGITNGLGFWFFPSTVLLILIPIIIGIRESFRKKNNEG